MLRCPGLSGKLLMLNAAMGEWTPSSQSPYEQILHGPECLSSSKILTMGPEYRLLPASWVLLMAFNWDRRFYGPLIGVGVWGPQDSGPILLGAHNSNLSSHHRTILDLNPEPT